MTNTNSPSQADLAYNLGAAKACEQFAARPDTTEQQRRYIDSQMSPLDWALIGAANAKQQ